MVINNYLQSQSYFVKYGKVLSINMKNSGRMGVRGRNKTEAEVRQCKKVAEKAYLFEYFDDVK